LLKPNDQVKFVICDKQDFDWSCFKIDEYDLTNKVSEVLFSASFAELEPRELADWIVAKNLDVRMQLQLHKYLWGDKPGV
jgi:7-carboxy-7-deazaguanine synthase